MIPLRFEFANEFRLPPAERGTSRRRATRAPIRWTAVPPSAAFRPRGVTPKRGNNVASPRGADNHPYPAKNWTGRTAAPAGAHFQDAGPNRSPAERRRIAEIKSIKYERTPRAPMIRNRRRRYVIITKGRAARMTSTRTAQFFWKRPCQTNLLQALPAGASRVASIAASLIGLNAREIGRAHV